MTPILELPGIGPHLASNLAELGISTVEQFVATPQIDLLEIHGLGARRLEILLEAARGVVARSEEPSVSHQAPVQAAAPKVEDTAGADVSAAPPAPKKAAKKADKKKAATGKDPKKEKARKKSKGKKEDSKKKAKAKAAAAEKAAAKKAKKAAKKKTKAKKKDKKSRKSKKK